MSRRSPNLPAGVSIENYRQFDAYAGTTSRLSSPTPGNAAEKIDAETLGRLHGRANELNYVAQPTTHL
jgi:hypothetical protein